jgi:hypothetical protein
LRHRDDGPAIEYADGRKEYWLNDERVTPEEFLRISAWRRLSEVELDTPEKVSF